MEPPFPRDGNPFYRWPGTPFFQVMETLYQGVGTPLPRGGNPFSRENHFVSGWQRSSMNIFNESDTHMLSLSHDEVGGG